MEVYSDVQRVEGTPQKVRKRSQPTMLPGTTKCRCKETKIMWATIEPKQS